MPKTRREQKRERREAKRKEKRRALRGQAAPRSIRSILHNALNWPVLECWTNKDWADPQQLNQVVVARRDPATGEVVVGLYLVDRACLGIKNAHSANFGSAHQFRSELLAHVRETQELIKVDFNLGAALVRAGVEYSEQLGFRPHRDFRNASILLKDANPDAVTEEIAVGGHDGKPYYFAGPYDNAEKVVNHLAQRLGPDGFVYIVPIDPETGVFASDGDWDMDDWDEVDDGEVIELKPFGDE